MNTVIIGAGITGLTCAWKLSENPQNQVILLEKEEAVGGLMRTIHKNGMAFDLGSHRIHELFPPDIFDIITKFGENDILKHKRNGQLYSHGRYIKYPPSLPSILVGFGLIDFVKFSLDYIIRFPNHIRKNRMNTDSYEDYMISMVGQGIYRRLYRPYALKLWGMDPKEVAPNPAVARTSNLELPFILRELMKKLRGGSGHYYFYPRKGIGIIADKMRETIEANGGLIYTSSTIEGFDRGPDKIIKKIFFKDQAGTRKEIEPNRIISTINMDSLLDLLGSISLGPEPVSPENRLTYRSLRLIYIKTGDRIPSAHETYYFPEPNYLSGRISELNKYSPDLNNRLHSTILTVEIPCTENDQVWNSPDEEIFDRCKKELIKAGLLKGKAGCTELCFSFKLKNVYPVYKLNWKSLFSRKYSELNSLKNLFLVGRNPLFLQCNMDHCIRMGLQLVDLLSRDGHIEKKVKWLEMSEEYFKFRLRY